jgi:hypothetical protein
VTDKPLVSIVTPTFPGREEVLIKRCIPSVLNQDWGNVEHVILSDRNPNLADMLPTDTRIRFAQINETWRNPITEASIGAVPWLVGSLMALGEFVGFLGDDDELLPEHVSEHVAAMREHQALFSVSQVEFRAYGVSQMIIGDDTFGHGHLDATGVMCHVSAFTLATWSANGQNAADWRLVNDWLRAGARGVHIPKVTGVHNDGWLVGATGRPDRM